MAAAMWVQGAIAAAGTLLLVLWLVMRPDMPSGWYLVFVLALTAVATAAATWRNWPALAAGAAVWSTVALGAQTDSAGDHQTLLMCFLLAANALLLVAAGARRWAGLAGMTLVQAVIVVAAWYFRHFQPADWPATSVFAWRPGHP
jgi:hypothetical protein